MGMLSRAWLRVMIWESLRAKCTFCKKTINAPTFANEPAKHCIHNRWIMGTLHRLLQTLPSAACPYSGTHFQLESWRKCQQTTSVVIRRVPLITTSWSAMWKWNFVVYSFTDLKILIWQLPLGRQGVVREWGEHDWLSTSYTLNRGGKL